MRSSYNRYNLLLFLLILSLPLYRFWNSPIAPGTIMAIVLFPLLIDYIIRSSIIKPFVLFFSFWLVYSFISILWAPTGAHVQNDMAFLLINSISFLEILVLTIKGKKSLLTISNAWASALFFTLLIAMWEINTGNHLANAREVSMYRTNEFGEQLLKVTASTFFYNPNTYCLFICFSFPFVLFNLSYAKRMSYLIFNIIILILAIFVMFTNASRGGILSLVLMFGVYLFYTTLKKRDFRSITYFTIILISVIIIFITNTGILDTIAFRLSSNSAFEDDTRLILWTESIKQFINSYGFGQGIGSMIPILQQSGAYGTYIFYTHNMLLELLLVHGLIITIGFVYLLWTLVKKSFVIKDVSQKICLQAALFPFPFYSLINSENTTPAPIWYFFGSLVAFSMFSLKTK